MIILLFGVCVVSGSIALCWFEFSSKKQEKAEQAYKKALFYGLQKDLRSAHKTIERQSERILEYEMKKRKRQPPPISAN